MISCQDAKLVKKNQKSQIRNSKQIQMVKTPMFQTDGFPVLGFEIGV